MDSSDKDGLSTDAVHVDAGASLNVIEMHVAKLGDEVDNIILGTHLEQREEGRQGGERRERERRERGGREEGERERERGGKKRRKKRRQGEEGERK